MPDRTAATGGAGPRAARGAPADAFLLHWREPSTWVLTVLAVGAVVAVGALVGQERFPVWPMGSVAVLVALATRLRWGVLVLAVAGIGAWVAVGPLGALAAALGLGVALLAAVGLLHTRLPGGRVESLASLLALVGVACLVVPLVSGVLAAAVLSVEGVGFGEGRAGLWMVMSALGGILIPVPFLVWWSSDPTPPRPTTRAEQLWALVLLAVSLVAGVAAVLFLTGVPTGYLLLVPVVWLAARWYAHGVVASVYAVMIALAVPLSFGLGGLDTRAGGYRDGDLWRLATLAMLMLVAGYLVAVTVRQRDEALARLRESHGVLLVEARAQAQTLAALMDNLPGVAFRCRNDEAYTALFLSDGAQDLLGRAPAELVSGRVSFADLVLPADASRVAETTARLHDIGDTYDLEYRIIRRDGSVRWVQERGRVVGFDTDGVALLEGVILDHHDQAVASELLRDEARLLDVALSRGRPARILSELADLAGGLVPLGEVGVAELAEDRTVRAWYSASGRDWTGEWPEPGASLPAGTWAHAAVRGAPQVDSVGDGQLCVVPVIGGRGSVAACLGWRLPEEFAPAPDVDALGRLALVAGVALDHVDNQARLMFESLHDPLTGLLNRRGIDHDLTELLRRATLERTDEASGGLLFLDVDDFRVVNETYGHDTGDAVLIGLAERAARVLPAGAHMARFSGDQFLVVVPGVSRSRLTALATELQGIASGPYRVGRQSLHLDLRVGVALARAGAGADDLITEASTACQASRDLGRGSLRVYDRGLRERSRRRLELQAELREALNRNEIQAWFQPVFDVRTGTVVGAEALARWTDDLGHQIPPDTFIPLAERTGLITQLGSQVLSRATRAAAEWPRSDLDGPLTVAVNVATPQLLDTSFLGSVADALDESGLPGDRLCLEITESALLETEAARSILRRVTDLGVQVAIDDFGTGYSSLARIKQFPVDLLKIDRAFVSGLGHDPDDTAIVEAVVALARALRLRTVAEGVETPAHLAELKSRGVDLAQGFLWSAALPPADFLSFLGRTEAHHG